MSNNEFMYFIHSCYTKPERKDTVLSLAEYEGMEYCSSILIENIFAMQFHPERSGPKGLEIYKKIEGGLYDR